MWEEVEGGYQIHDYLDYNPSRREVLQLRKNRAKAGQSGGLAKAKQKPDKAVAGRKQKSTPVPDPVVVVGSEFAVGVGVPEPPTSRAREKGSEFDRFWEAYPKHRHVNKKAAVDQWKLQKPPVEEVLRTLEIWKASADWTRDGGQYVPHPHRWLKARRWEDEPPVAAAGYRPDPTTRTAQNLAAGDEWLRRRGVDPQKSPREGRALPPGTGIEGLDDAD